MARRTESSPQGCHLGDECEIAASDGVSCCPRVNDDPIGLMEQVPCPVQQTGGIQGVSQLVSESLFADLEAIMKVLFTVQGEGRGHLTQALAMKEMLERRGHQVVAVLVSSNGSRPIPGYFSAGFTAPVRVMSGPGFAFPGARGVSGPATFRRLVRDLPRFARSLRLIRETLHETRPGLVVNFLEPLMGFYNLVSRARVPTVVVGHQYMLDHPAFPRIRCFRSDRRFMRGYLALAGARSTRLALSFYPAPNLPGRRLVVCPPLLRRQLFELESTPGDYLLVYLLNHGYAAAIRRWHTLHPHIPVHCFHDRPGAPSEERVAPNLTFHTLHGDKFLPMMAGARAVVCTAGFESACEAAYLGKPLLMIPVENHVEQYLNACDAEQAGLGLRDDDFRLARLLAPGVQGAAPEFRRWVDRAEALAVEAVETAAGLRPAPMAGIPAPVDSMTRELAV